jgi:glycogen debranching enzyme
MNILHSFPQRNLKRNVKADCKALLTNKNGSFMLLESSPSTRYSGLFWHADGERMFRIIEHIFLQNVKNPLEIVNNYYAVKWKYKENELGFFLPTNSSSVVCELKNNAKIGITLDVKDAYDNREWGRHYNVWEEQNCLVIGFAKRTDSREDGSHDQEEYSLHVAIAGHDSVEIKKEWVQREYVLDKQRTSPPSSRYVYLPALVEGKKIVCSVGWTKNSAIKEAKTLAKRTAILKQKEVRALTLLKKEKVVKQIFHSSLPDASKMAFLCSVSSLDRLLVHSSKELFAGLPWFFQSWVRDALISSKAITLLHPSMAQSIAEKSLAALQKDGTMEAVPGKGVKSVDAMGWLFKRLGEMNYSVGDSQMLKRKTTELAEFLLSNNGKGMLWHTQSQETWMDTSVGGGRGGERIEVQAAMLCMLKAAAEITGNGKYRTKEKQMLQKVRKAFWDGKILFDGSDDPTIRPNMFVAAYLYPELLSKEEWETCFENALKSLWLPWGGLSTIDKKHPLFKFQHTGQNPESYHHGDSWYWINNLAALVMCRVNKQKFKFHIEKILSASAQEILWLGAVGSHAELSSAKQQTSEGCLSQAWSNAMFVELCMELAR